MQASGGGLLAPEGQKATREFGRLMCLGMCCQTRRLSSKLGHYAGIFFSTPTRGQLRIQFSELSNILPVRFSVAFLFRSRH